MISCMTHRFKTLCRLFPHIRFGITPAQAEDNTLIILPNQPNTLNCGICALVAFKGKNQDCILDAAEFKNSVNQIQEGLLSSLEDQEFETIQRLYLGGDELLDTLFAQAQDLKQETLFQALFDNAKLIGEFTQAAEDLNQLVNTCRKEFQAAEETLATREVELISQRLDKLRDIAWALDKEILDNIQAIQNLGLAGGQNSADQPNSPLPVFKRINAVLNAIDRLEVRGRDSAGISVLFTLAPETFEAFRQKLNQAGLTDILRARSNQKVLANNSITIQEGLPDDSGIPTIGLAFTYKFAAEIGALGDNVAFLRSQVKNDHILHLLSAFSSNSVSVSAHTRWASVGDITEPNCHPVDNTPTDNKIEKSGILHVCLNGDIDNYLELKTEYEAHYDKIHKDINTDTKLIPLQIEHHLKHGADIEEAFRLAVNDFSGSHAISLHTDLAPGKLFLAQKGSGQAIFVGIAQDHYIAASELYGVVEETQNYIKLNGEDKGQIVVLDQNSPGGLEGIRSLYYNGEPIHIDEDQLLSSQIPSRDIDRQGFPPYCLKEISESPNSVDKTLENKFKVDADSGLFGVKLPEQTVPQSIVDELIEGKINRVYFIGQGTAGIAAQGCADLLTHYLGDQKLYIRALKASELSGFSMNGDLNDGTAMANTLVVAISQSGTTTDTNRTVDMVKACGARTLAIVNRRESDLTFKTDGVLYTSSGRDIEMSVASTKAFYSQLTAGAILGLHIAAVTGSRSPEFIAQEIQELLSLPEKMNTVLALKEEIKTSADTTAVTKNYWATVGSGSNKTASDEIRIKLSELCYKTISSDFVEDKKHIDLSSEPLIIICAAGTRESVLGDIIKDTAIFSAHKATPIVITTEGEDRFDPYSKHIFKIPHVPEHFAPLLNTLVGHLWGYYAALAINQGSSFLYEFRTQTQDLLDEYTSQGRDAYEALLENKFREKAAAFYNRFSKKRREDGFPAALGLDNAANITLLLKYLSGRLPASDFEIDFSVKGTPANIIDTFFSTLGQAVNTMARPVDAIKHQAKTVTVGTSRIQEKFEGPVFDAVFAHGIQISQITHKNVLVLKNLQEILSEIKGALLYKISGLNLLGEVTQATRITVERKTGILENETSRVESDPRLKGTKNIIVREGNVYIGKGRKDQRNILVIPVLSASPETPNIIEYILSLNVDFKPSEDISLLKKIKALGGKYPRLKDWILESENIQWDDTFLNKVDVGCLFGDTAETVVEKIIKELK